MVPSTKKYDELTAVLSGHLKPKPLVKFHHRNQRDGEKVAQYMAELRRLSQKDLTLESAYEIALSEETASLRASELQASVKTGASPDGDVQRLASGKPHNRGGSTKSCYRCGKSGHHPDRCFYRHQKCRACQVKGHIAKMCKNKGAPHRTPSPGASPFDRENKNKAAGNKKVRSAGYVDIESGEQSEDNGSEDTQLFAISEPRYSPMVVKPTVDGVELKMELDTGATVSLESERVWKEVFKKCPLEKCQTLLRTYTGERLPVLGQLNVTVEYEDEVRFVETSAQKQS